MNKCKSFLIDFYGNKYNIALTLGTYTNNERLYIGAIDPNNGELFSDITVNIPETPLKDNEVILNVGCNDIPDNLIKLGIIELTEKTTISGFNEYKIARFNEKKAKNYIYCDFRGCE